MEGLPYVLVIVLNWDGLADTLECLEAPARLDCPVYEAVAVDNGSLDGPVPVMRNRFPMVTMLENSENLAYTGTQPRSCVQRD